jgi:hypothetical protein
MPTAVIILNVLLAVAVIAGTVGILASSIATQDIGSRCGRSSKSGSSAFCSMLARSSSLARADT